MTVLNQHRCTILRKDLVLNFNELLTKYWQTAIEWNKLAFMYTDSKLPCVFIFNTVTCLFRINKACDFIDIVMRWTRMNAFCAHFSLSHCAIQLCLSFSLFAK